MTYNENANAHWNIVNVSAIHAIGIFAIIIVVQLSVSLSIRFIINRTNFSALDGNGYNGMSYIGRIERKPNKSKKKEEKKKKNPKTECMNDDVKMFTNHKICRWRQESVFVPSTYVP